MQRIHILGICGTFMAGIAALAQEKGFQVTGSDRHRYPPMSDFLTARGIPITQGYDDLTFLKTLPDQVIIGNALKRGDPCVEAVLNAGIPYLSGPAWLASEVLPGRRIVAIAGTHGKTTVTSLLSWLLEAADLHPGFLIGGIPINFGQSARLGQEYFIVEADEYDSAFFDKRPKFMHYRPQGVVLTNLEYDHADIYPDLAAIQLQFSYLLRTVPSNGFLIAPQKDTHLDTVLAKENWTPCTRIGETGAWRAQIDSPDGSQFQVFYENKYQGTVHWSLLGEHNVANALSALAGAHHLGISIQHAIEALTHFKGVKRRLEHYQTIRNIHIYDDFAHHPTAIHATLAGLRQHIGPHKRILVLLHCGTHTMRSHQHRETLGPALQLADHVWILRPEPNWTLNTCTEQTSTPIHLTDSIAALTKQLAEMAQPSDHIVIMSNQNLDALHESLIHNLTVSTLRV